MSTDDRNSSKRRRALRATAAVVVLEAVALWLRSGKLGGNIVVRCRDGHLFTTIWIPAVSIKALRLGPWRVQRCPVGHHWTIVTPVKEAALTAEQFVAAREHHDLRVP
jgi:hypothetical protein